MLFVEQPLALLRSAKDRVCLVGESLFFQGQQSEAQWQYFHKYTVQNNTGHQRTLNDTIEHYRTVEHSAFSEYVGCMYLPLFCYM